MVMQEFNQKFFQELFEAEFKGLCYFAVRYVKDIDTARGIVQDAFVQLWKKRETIDVSRPVKSYLTTSVHNRCLNYLRDSRKYNERMVEIEHLSEVEGDYGSDLIAQKELQTAIKNAIEELPEKCRQIFLLSRNENLKYQEIADKLGISQKTVETQMSKALQHLRTRLSAYLPAALIWFFLLTK